MEGIGSELGVLNLALYALGVGSLLLMVQRIKLLLQTDWVRMLSQHRKMWRVYEKKRMEDSSTDIGGDI